MLKPPQTYEVLPDCKGLMDSSTYGSDFGQVVVPEGDVLELDEPAADANGSWRRSVLMPVINGVSEQKEFLDKVRGFRFKVRCDLMPPQKDEDTTYDELGLNLEAFLEGLHQKVYEVLHLAELTLTKAEQLYKIKRIRTPGTMHRDPDKGFRYMTAEYLTVLGPTN